jgi:5-methylcytosine-specific restriction endonuclease McrA
MPLKDPEKRREYRRLHREINAEYCHQYHAEHREEILERQRRYRNEHRLELRVKGAAFARKFRLEHPEAEINHSARRRNRTQESEISKDEWLAVMRMYNWHCAYCGQSLSTRETRTIDHVVPLALGGAHTPLNLVAACRFCNNSKQNRMPHEWTQCPVLTPAVAQKLWAITLINLPLAETRWSTLSVR